LHNSQILTVTNLKLVTMSETQPWASEGSKGQGLAGF